MYIQNLSKCLWRPGSIFIAQKQALSFCSNRTTATPGKKGLDPYKLEQEFWNNGKLYLLVNLDFFPSIQSIYHSFLDRHRLLQLKYDPLMLQTHIQCAYITMHRYFLAQTSLYQVVWMTSLLDNKRPEQDVLIKKVHIIFRRT